MQRRAGLGFKGDACTVTRATLITLGKRLTGEEAEELAVQPPSGIQGVRTLLPDELECLFEE